MYRDGIVERTSSARPRTMSADSMTRTVPVVSVGVSRRARRAGIGRTGLRRGMAAPRFVRVWCCALAGRGVMRCNEVTAGSAHGTHDLGGFGTEQCRDG